MKTAISCYFKCPINSISRCLFSKVLLHQSFPLQIESLVGTTNSGYLMEWELCLHRSPGPIIKLCYAFLVFRISDLGLRRTCNPRSIGNVLGWYFMGLCDYAGCSITCALSIPGGANPWNVLRDPLQDRQDKIIRVMQKAFPVLPLYNTTFHLQIIPALLEAPVYPLDPPYLHCHCWSFGGSLCNFQSPLKFWMTCIRQNDGCCQSLSGQCEARYCLITIYGHTDRHIMPVLCWIFFLYFYFCGL